MSRITILILVSFRHALGKSAPDILDANNWLPPETRMIQLECASCTMSSPSTWGEPTRNPHRWVLSPRILLWSWHSPASRYCPSGWKKLCGGGKSGSVPIVWSESWYAKFLEGLGGSFRNMYLVIIWFLLGVCCSHVSSRSDRQKASCDRRWDWSPWAPTMHLGSIWLRCQPQWKEQFLWNLIGFTPNLGLAVRYGLKGLKPIFGTTCRFYMFLPM